MIPKVDEKSVIKKMDIATDYFENTFVVSINA
jgi:hypothetical protein